MNQLGEVVRQLRLGQAGDLVIETRADAADGARVGVDGLRLQAFAFEVLEMGLDMTAARPTPHQVTSINRFSSRASAGACA